jgi:formylglycine-generating enzyme required for sulfatase activity
MLDAVVAELKTDLDPGFESFLKGNGGRTVNSDLKSVEEERLKVAGSTQNFTLSVRDVTAALAEYVAAGGKFEDASKPTFRLEPEGEGKPFPPTGTSSEFKKVPFKWYRGIYTVKAYASKDAKRPFAVLGGIAAKDAPGNIEIPNKAPEGMVWVPALKAGGDALFIDRYEVTVGQVEAVAGSDETLAQVLKDSREGGSDPNLPAYFAESKYIGAFEKATGKRSPTADQWLQAGFQGRGIAERPFPWGQEPPDSTRAYAIATGEKPEPVGGRPAGAAACGAEDMVGNLCEWVRKDGQYWVIGGYWSMGMESLAGFEGHLPAREPMPQVGDFNQMSAAQQGVYGKFKFDTAGFYLCGLRTVVPVPAK